MRIAIYGGGFNPVHTAHTMIARHVARLDDIDEVWMAPCYGHKYGKYLVEIEHRIRMCEIATEEEPGVQASDIENRYKLDGSTYELLLKVFHDFPEHSFSLVMGQDNADEIEKWHEYERLISMVPCIVFPTADNEPTRSWYLNKPHRYLSNCPTMETRATYVRRMLFKDRLEEASDSISEKVLDYIIDNELYETGDDY